jgi:hypothetical protein
MEAAPVKGVAFFIYRKDYMEVIKVEKSGLKENWSVKVSGALNGVVMETCEGEKYVYKTAKEAAKNLEGIISILQDEPKQVTEEDLDEEEERIKENG